MNVKGLSIQDVMNIGWDEINKLNPKDLKQLTSRLVSASNKRIRALQKADAQKVMFSFALQKSEKMGRQFSIRGKDVNQIKQEFRLMKDFLSMQTSTVKGAKSYTRSVMERTGQYTEGESLNWSNRTWKKYWKTYRMFDETHHGTYKKGDSDRIQQMLTEIMDSGDKRLSSHTFEERLEDAYNRLYEEQQEMDDIDSYFDLGGEE